MTATKDPTVLEFQVASRSPFRHGAVSPLLRVRRAALASGIRPLRNLSKFVTKLWHRRLGIPMRGTFGVVVDGQVRWVTISTRNGHLETVLTWPVGAYEPPVRALIDNFLPQDGTFFDIGANWGYYTTFAASRPGFSGQIVSFEPFPPTYQDLTNVLAQTNLGQRVRTMNMALSDRDGEVHMVIPHSTGHAQAHMGQGGEGVQVAARRLDGLGLPAPDLVKVDVEGHELSALTGAEKVLTEHRPVVILENWVLPDSREITLGSLRYLVTLGYRIFLPRVVHTPGGHSTLRLDEVSPEARLEHPEVVDVCAIHREQVGKYMDTTVL